jgi:hypothetical protein
VVTLTVTEAEYAAVSAAVRKRAPPPTVSGWFLEHALAALGPAASSRSGLADERDAYVVAAVPAGCAEEVRMRSVAEPERPTLSETGQIYVTHAAARGWVEAAGYKEHEVESARRELTELLLDARQQPDPRMWRARKRSTKWDISAIVEHEGRLLVVTFISAQRYDPPSRTSAARQGRRSRFPVELRGGSMSGTGSTGHRAAGGLRGTRFTRRG